MNIDISDIPVNILGLISLGCISGFLSGFFGIGGGPLITPVLNILFGIPFPICIGSTLSRTAGTTFSAVLRYWKFGNIDAKLALMIVGGNFVGIEIGVYLLDWLDKLGEISVGSQSMPALQFYLQWLFFGVLITVSGLILIESLIHRGKSNYKQPPGLLRYLPIPPYVSFPITGVRRISLPAIVYSALIIGIFTGLLGIGGGILFVPLLIYGYGVETHAAVGTTSLIVFFSAAYGTATHAMRGNVDLWLVVFLLIGSTICAQVGVIANQRIQGDSIRFCFAFIVLLVAGMIGFNLLRVIYG